MSSRERAEDVSTILFLVPFIGAAVDALYLWAQFGLSATLPAVVYLDVTRDPYVFLIGLLAVFAGTAVDISSEQPAKRKERVSKLSVNLQEIAAAAFVLSLICALYANGFDPTNSGLAFVVGRYSIVFPAIVVLFSILVVIPWSGRTPPGNTIAGIVLMLLVPVVLDEVGKRDTLIALVIAFVLIVAGAFSLTRTPKKEPEEEEK